MSFSHFFVASVAAGLLCAPLFAQEAVQSPPAETVEPPALEQAKPEEEKPRPKAKEKEEKPVRDLQDSMTAEQFKAAGLDKLSPQELKALNASLRGERQAAEVKATEKATAEVKKKAAAETHAKMDSLLSRVDDEAFAGIKGRTIIKLEDGTTWKQANEDDHFRATVTNRPPVRVVHGPFGYKMRIVGTGEFYVNPVR
jgi:cytoskeletal protein RodZ